MCILSSVCLQDMTLYQSVKLNFIIITLVQQFPQAPSARRSASVHFKSLLVCHSAFQNLICATPPLPGHSENLSSCSIATPTSIYTAGGHVLLPAIIAL